MKVLSLKIENLRKIQIFESKFTKSGLVQIRGKNGQGKTTVLDAFAMLFKGKKAIPADVVTHGKEKAKIVGCVGDYIIERQIGEKAKLKISNKDGLTLSSKPQAFLDTLINELTFDPKPFLEKTSDQKLKFLMELLDLDFVDVDNEIAVLEQERLFVGRKVKEFGAVEVLEKIEPVDVVALIADKDAIDKNNLEALRLAELRTSYGVRLETLKSDMEKLKAKIKEGEAHIKDVEQQLKKVKVKDVEAIKSKIEKSFEINALAQKYSDNLQKIEAKKEVEKSYQSFTDQIEKKRSSKADKLKQTKMPVKGLEIKEDGVYYKGNHSDNWSTAEALKISFELCVSMKPKLNAVFIDNGESYDTEGLNNLKKWAKKNDLQVFITIVDSGAPGEVEDAIYLEEGVMHDDDILYPEFE